MSLQRIFESARRLQVPIIVTDPAGRDPMVLLTLEHFEAMAGSQEGETVAKPAAKPKATLSEKWEPQSEPLPVEAEKLAEISLEERFYLEPVDEENA